MKKILFALAAVCSLAYAQDEAALTSGMKGLGKETGLIRKADPKTGAEVVAAAERVAAHYQTSKEFFAKKGSAFEDAVKWSDEGKTIALAGAAAAKSGDAAAAASAFQKLGGTCKSCHDVHREKLADGTYKIK